MIETIYDIGRKKFLVDGKCRQKLFLNQRNIDRLNKHFEEKSSRTISSLKTEIARSMVIRDVIFVGSRVITPFCELEICEN
jgi:hypothetical protein